MLLDRTPQMPDDRAVADTLTEIAIKAMFSIEKKSVAAQIYHFNQELVRLTLRKRKISSARISLSNPPQNLIKLSRVFHGNGS
ncbi:protein of unknown function [Stenotrophomonas maltophilia]|nr:protein of unknown function [Stenotrophomonas maltophilia]